MLFNSYVFIFAFLPMVLGGWWLWRNHPHHRLAFLTLASYFFYGWWNWKFVPLMIASTAVDHLAALRIHASEDPRVRRRWLICSMTFNLMVLGIFKYLGFFMTSAQGMAHALRLDLDVPLWHIVLPIGISFYTFNSMSYTIDVYRRLVKPAPSILHFSAFVAMFPHLVAGPIVRWADMEHQFQRLKRALTAEQAAHGIYLFSLGMAKKLLIADQLAGPVNAFFTSPNDHGATASWILVTGYGLQLYFDFSGYSDMAVGLAHFLGLQFPQNFNSPYKAQNPSDFWRRWHISLSTWLRDYLFIPLGGSKGGRWKTLRNLAITMFLGGLWHGAQWTFVLWGIYHGVLLALHALLRRQKVVEFSLAGRRVVTFVLVTLGWVLFRASTIAKAGTIYLNLFGRNGLGEVDLSRSYLLLFAVALAITQFAPNSWELELQPRRSWAFACALLLCAAILLLTSASPFLYFQF